jgi:hypothetical protein
MFPQLCSPMLSRVLSRTCLLITVPIALALVLAPAHAGTVSPVQSSDRPMDLSLWAEVQLAASDARAEAFQTDVLPDMLAVVNTSLGESKQVNDLASVALDPNRLVLQQESAVRVYFIGEGAGYHNTLGAFTGDPSALMNGLGSTDARLIFPDASSPASWLGDAGSQRTESTPLLAGDFVDLGSLAAGEQINFFIPILTASSTS